MLTHCPKCQSENIYQDGYVWMCPECSHEWSESEAKVVVLESDEAVVKDANGNILLPGDSVMVIKDLKVKGAASTIRSGTKIKSIRISDGGDGHNVAAKIEGLGLIHLKAQFLRKA